VHDFLKTTANAVARDGVTVNMPGGHATDRMRAVYGDTPAVADAIPVGLGRPENFGATAAFLCSDAAGFITGSALPVHGGSYGGLF
jgi:3-oxoacyl-[acyl-carrier protein] reductase